MQPFNFESAQTEQGAAAAGAKSQSTRFIAGGTTLIDLMKLHVETPNRLVDLSAVPLKKIEEKSGSVFVGAMVNNSDMAHHDLIKTNFPVLSEALLSGASVQLRNLATTGGNLLQRTRCSYFRDTACACNKRQPGSGCSALDGQNRMHAILGTSDRCIATNPSDMCVALAALGAKVHTQSANTNQMGRIIEFADFHRLPGQTPNIETSLHPGELITAIEIPKTPWFKNSKYVKVRDRASYAFALTSAAVALDMNGELVRNVRIALGGVGTIPWRAKEAETALEGQKLDAQTIARAADRAMVSAKPHKQNAFKVEMAKRTLIRALFELGGVK
jgi:xanthine dehydrogenase YagS FAD-binding subunit